MFNVPATGVSTNSTLRVPNQVFKDLGVLGGFSLLEGSITFLALCDTISKFCRDFPTIIRVRCNFFDEKKTILENNRKI